MISFRRTENIETPYINPYEAILKEINRFDSKLIANVLVINPNDYPHLVKSAQANKVFPTTRNDLSIIGSCRIYRSKDMQEGSFVIAGF